MKNQQHIELIEGYIKNNLSTDQRQEVEQRMAADVDFRQDVELHRHMHEHYRDAVRRRLLSVVQEVMESKSAIKQPPKALVSELNSNLGKWLGLLAVILAVGILVWKLQDQEVVPTPPLNPPLDKPVVPGLTPTIEEKQVALPKEKPATSPIAQADPANFIPNQAMEDNLSGVRGGDWEASLSSPKNSDAFQLDSEGKALVAFKGILLGGDAATTFSLLVYNNRDSKRPILSQKLAIQPNNKGELVFDVKQVFQLKPGLYYFTVVEDGEGEEVWVGKFLIREMPH
jgi:hypothetical protein